jgi:two-component system phosphate regulon sensor histidine kinase PhoR
MKQRTIWAVIGLMAVAFVGLIAVQWYWLTNAAALKERLFRAGVHRALTSVVQRLETKETQASIARSLNSLHNVKQSVKQSLSNNSQAGQRKQRQPMLSAAAASNENASVNQPNSHPPRKSSLPSSSSTSSSEGVPNGVTSAGTAPNGAATMSSSKMSSSKMDAPTPQPSKRSQHSSQHNDRPPISNEVPTVPPLPPAPNGQPTLIVQHQGQTIRVVIPSMPPELRDMLVGRLRGKLDATRETKETKEVKEIRDLLRPEEFARFDSSRKTLRQLMEQGEYRKALKARRVAQLEWQIAQRERLRHAKDYASNHRHTQLSNRRNEARAAIDGEVERQFDRQIDRQFDQDNRSTERRREMQHHILTMQRTIDEQRRLFGFSLQTADSVVQMFFHQQADGFSIDVSSAPVIPKSAPNAVPSGNIHPPTAAKRRSPTEQPTNRAVSLATGATERNRARVTELRQQNHHQPRERDTIEKIVYRADLIEKVLEDMTRRSRNICERLDTAELAAMLSAALKEQDIHLPFELAVQRAFPDSILLVKASTHTQHAPVVPLLLNSEFKARLFPNDLIGEHQFLLVRFPDYQPDTTLAFTPVLAASAVSMALILGCFGFVMLAFVQQKKLSDMKTDFINNMTHELKTPIATIAIASEALQDDHLRTDPQRVERFVGVIYEENKRLASHVETVLQAAQMERGELQLALAETNIHDLVETAVESLALQLEQKQGQLLCRLEATKAECIADETHLTNVIFNLLDNAIKYSPERPHITITTRNTAQHLVLTVEDRGLGMSKEAQKHVFEKFYRVPTGNRHDVKGFGLGLSYVQSIVEAHGGSVSVQSELGKGSRFELLLPAGATQA